MSNYSFYNSLARRILKHNDKRFAKPIVRLSMFGVSLGVTIMLIALGVTHGYKNVIEEKVVAMGQHISVSHYDNNYSFEQIPISFNDTLTDIINQFKEITAVQPYATKVGIVKTDDQVEGIVLKGVNSSFDGENFAKNIIEGDTPSFSDSAVSNNIVISKRLSNKLKLNIGDKVRTYFVQDPPRQRSFTVVGIYETGMPEFDSKMAIVDIRHIQKLNDWTSDQVSGVELLTNNYDNIDEIGEKLHQSLDVNLKAETIKQQYPDIFSWIALFDTNVMVLLIITTIVCMITMMSVFFIIILEQTQLIGILKTMGMRTAGIVKTFLIIAGYTLAGGLFIGNFIALGLGFLQQKFHFIKLDPDTYYINYVPIQFDVIQVVILNICVFVACLLVLIVPAWFVSKKISPVKSVSFR